MFFFRNNSLTGGIRIWILPKFRNKNVNFIGQELWPPKFYIKFRYTKPPPLFRNHSLKQFFSASHWLMSITFADQDLLVSQIPNSKSKRERGKNWDVFIFRDWTFLSPLTEEVEGAEALLEIFLQVFLYFSTHPFFHLWFACCPCHLFSPCFPW